VLPKFPLVVGLFAIVFAVGSLFGSEVLGAGITRWRLTDFLVWIGVTAGCFLVLGCYCLVLQRVGILPKPAQSAEEPVQPVELTPDGGKATAVT
jgi:hypothetical protein